MKHFWKTKYSISFPRITEMVGEFKPEFPITDRQLCLLIFAFRMVFPDIGITLSTRESSFLRDQIIPLGITQISAESSTSPGGYTQQGAEKQFETTDHRSKEEIIKVLKRFKLEPVAKNWDLSLS